MDTLESPAETGLTQAAPYIFFYGRCEEAFDFYRSVLGGTYDVMRNTDVPMNDHCVPDGFSGKVMHATFTAPGITLLGSDGSGPREIDPDEGNICIGLRATDRAQGDRVFAGLSAGGKVKRALEAPPFGGERFGSFVDRFGIEWMFASP